jgi:hypothetical protein
MPNPTSDGSTFVLASRRQLAKIKHEIRALLGKQETPISIPADGFRYAFYRGQDGKGRHLFTMYAKAKSETGSDIDLHGHMVRMSMDCCNVFSDSAVCTKSAATENPAPASDPIPAGAPAPAKSDGEIMKLEGLTRDRVLSIQGVPSWTHKIKAEHNNLPDQVVSALDEIHDWAEEVLKTPEVKKVLDEPVDTGRVVTKKDGELEIFLPFVKTDLEQRTVYGVVYEPDVVDAQGDSASADEIRKACHDYMINSRKTGLMHKEDVTGKAPAIENYLAPNDMVIGNQRVRKGTWIMAHKILDDSLWNDVKSGKLTGLSMSGKAMAASD